MFYFLPQGLTIRSIKAYIQKAAFLFLLPSRRSSEKMCNKLLTISSAQMQNELLFGIVPMVTSKLILNRLQGCTC